MLCTCRISEIIPPRPPLPKKVLSAQLAEKHYSSCIRTLAGMISKEYQNFKQSQSRDAHSTDYDQLQSDFLYYLNTNGVYDEMKVTLKNKISVLLQEKSDIKPNAADILAKQVRWVSLFTLTPLMFMNR